MGHVYGIKTMISKNDRPIIFFTITTYKEQKEGDKDKPQFHNCVAYGKLASLLSEHLKEKANLCIEGELDYYEKEGVRHSQVIVHKSHFTGAKTA